MLPIIIMMYTHHHIYSHIWQGTVADASLTTIPIVWRMYGMLPPSPLLSKCIPFKV